MCCALGLMRNNTEKPSSFQDHTCRILNWIFSLQNNVHLVLFFPDIAILVSKLREGTSDEDFVTFVDMKCQV